MSFRSILAGIGKGIATGLGIVEKDVVPTLQGVDGIVTMFNPPAGKAINMILSAISAVEMVVTTAQQGAQKKLAVMQILQAELPQLRGVLTSAGLSANLDAEKVSAAVDATVAALNAYTALFGPAASANISPAPAPFPPDPKKP